MATNKSPTTQSLGLVIVTDVLENGTAKANAALRMVGVLGSGTSRAQGTALVGAPVNAAWPVLALIVAPSGSTYGA